MRRGRDMVLVALVAALFLTIFVLDKPILVDKEQLGVATVEAAQEYERVLERWGDAEMAAQASDIVFKERMEAGWK